MNYFTIYYLGGWIGFICILLSIYMLNKNNIRRSVKAGLVGCGFIVINLSYMSIMIFIPTLYSTIIFLNYFTPILLFIALIGFCVINWRLFRSITPPKDKSAFGIRSIFIITATSIIYLILVILYLIVLILGIFLLLYGIGSNIIFIMLLVGLILIATSLVYLIRELNIKRTTLFGTLAAILLILLEYLSYYIYDVYTYIRVVILILIFIVNISLLRYRAIEPSSLSDRITMIKESNLYDVVKRKELTESNKSKQVQESIIRVPEIADKKVKSKNIISANEVAKRLTPEELEEQHKTESEMGIEKKEFMCVVHKGAIDGPIYLCPNCHTLYCQKCATALKEEGELCWSCDTEINL